MNIISQGKIFLSDQRGMIESERIKRYSTFNSESFQNPAKEAVGNLYALHDDMLAPNASINFYTREQGYVIIIPITGSIKYIDEQSSEAEIEVGKSLMAFLEKDAFITLKNPYEDALINYMMIAIKTEEKRPNSLTFLDIDLSKLNTMNLITPETIPFKVSIGRFKGRGETKYAINNKSTLYCFVLGGAFEIDGRLLHDRDGIALWNTDKIEMEALSDNALLLTIQLPQQSSYILF
ncbi:hypothetical protein [Pedobacter xixiisoli]|uniref:Quercetin 2,3-dioxygenase C-terminal cupin domain-containing protein n=1 Tax=Pedobacter xixiisoli TaxID=1476464 RepID=A0A286A6N0_9SPHI|nr:hypothetical protein [Pedobacter xixiisoli]SOD17461.1 hypothetical protein SAMN06297358_2543 [Pedobacter xixiisoli]